MECSRNPSVLSDYWYDLLCPANSTSTIIAQGDPVGPTLRKKGVTAAHRPYVLTIRDDDVAAEVEAGRKALGSGTTPRLGKASGKSTEKSSTMKTGGSKKPAPARRANSKRAGAVKTKKAGGARTKKTN